VLVAGRNLVGNAADAVDPVADAKRRVAETGLEMDVRSPFLLGVEEDVVDR